MSSINIIVIRTTNPNCPVSNHRRAIVVAVVVVGVVGAVVIPTRSVPMELVCLVSIQTQ